MKKLIALCFVILFSDKSFALYGGKKLAQGAFPSVLTLVFEDPENPKYTGSFCSGILITPNKVLTTAHCIAGMGWEVFEDYFRLELFPAFLKVRTGKGFVQAKKVKFAPNYFEEWDRSGEDLAVIELSSSIKTIVPMPLAKKSELKPGVELKLVARGRSAETSLLEVEEFPYATVLKMDGEKAGACRGDSGGAVLVKRNSAFALAGILVYDGDGNCEKKNGRSYFPKGILQI